MTTPAWWNAAYPTRFSVDTGTAPAGYTLTVAAGPALSAGADVRVIVHDTTTTELDRLIAGTSVTFKVPAAGTVWLYAGPTTSTPPANPANVYVFAENFDALAAGTNADGPFIPLPAIEWIIIDDAGNHIFRTGMGGRHSAAIRDLTITDSEIETRMRFGPGGTQNHAGVAARGNSMATTTFDGFVGQLMQNINRTRIAEYTNGASPPLELAGNPHAVPRATWFTVRMRMIGSAVQLFVDDVQVATVAQTSSDGQLIGLLAVDCDVDYDDVRVRMAMTPEPVATLGAEQRCE